MTFSRVVVLGIALWVTLISGLHAVLNWGVLDPAQVETEARAKFRVGYLPVT